MMGRPQRAEKFYKSKKPSGRSRGGPPGGENSRDGALRVTSSVPFHHSCLQKSASVSKNSISKIKYQFNQGVQKAPFLFSDVCFKEA